MPDSIVFEIALLGMSVATVLSTTACFYLYRWRQIITAERALFVPEELVARFRALTAEFARQERLVSTSGEGTAALIRLLEKKVDVATVATSDLAKASRTWQDALDDRDTEIRRLKEGYDFEVMRRFVGRFARAKSAADDFYQESDFSAKAFDHVRRLLADALEECGVEEFAPKVGDDFRNVEGVEDNPRTIATGDPAEAFRIIEVMARGYRFTRNGQGAVILAKKCRG
ncbi:hypothetical protein [Bradyrhizobium sp. LB11.1]|uniref:hypothetical protein n=1 Tax=Bradyrhizobium sp. LB11.1 TaxID=3156326 RepID=UPI00339182F1